MVLLQLQVDLAYEIADPAGADFILNVHAARTAHQTVESESLNLSQDVAADIATDAVTSLSVSGSARWCTMPMVAA